MSSLAICSSFFILSVFNVEVYLCTSPLHWQILHILKKSRKISQPASLYQFYINLFFYFSCVTFLGGRRGAFIPRKITFETLNRFIADILPNLHPFLHDILKNWNSIFFHCTDKEKHPSRAVLRKRCSKIYTKFTGQHLCWGVISIKPESKFIGIPHILVPVQMLLISGLNL